MVVSGKASLSIYDMLQILEKVAKNLPQLGRPQDKDPLEFGQKQLDFYMQELNLLIPLEADPAWVFALLTHFQSMEDSPLKHICHQHPKLANQFLFYLDNRYRLSQIYHLGVKNPMQVFLCLRQRLNADPTGLYPFAEGLTDFYFNIWWYRWSYDAHHRSNMMLATMALLFYRFFSMVFASIMFAGSIIFTFCLVRGAGSILSNIEWSILDWISNGQYTKNLEILVVDKYSILLWLCDSLEEWRYEDVTSIENARLNHINSSMKWPIDEITGERASESLREVEWRRHLRSIYRKYDFGTIHLSLVAKTFHQLSVMPSQSQRIFQSIEIILRFRYILVAIVMFVLAIVIQLLTEYFPNMMMFGLLMMGMMADFCLHHSLGQPFYENKTASDLSYLVQENREQNNPTAQRFKPSYFFRRCDEVRAQLHKEQALSMESLVPLSLTWIEGNF